MVIAISAELRGDSFKMSVTWSSLATEVGFAHRPEELSWY